MRTPSTVGGNVLIGALLEQKYFSMAGGADVLMSPGWSSVISSGLFAVIGPGSINGNELSPAASATRPPAKLASQ